MKETIHYTRFDYITDENHLKEVLNYITRNFKIEKSLTTLDKSKRDIWIQRAKDEKSIRKDSRIALRFFLTLPNDQRNNIEFRKKVVKKLIQIFDIPSNHIDVAFHLDSENNYHMHVIIYIRKKDGKKLRLSKSDLKNFHNEWNKFLENEGYKIKRKNKNIETKPYWKYMRQKTEEMGYIPIPDFIINEEMINEGKKRFLKKLKKLERKLNEEEAKKIRVMIKKIEIEKEDKIIENMIEKEATKEAENRLIRKVMKTKEYLYKPLENPLGNPDDNLNINNNWIDNWNNRMKF
jgi:hypothetical protein